MILINYKLYIIFVGGSVLVKHGYFNLYAFICAFINR